MRMPRLVIAPVLAAGLLLTAASGAALMAQQAPDRSKPPVPGSPPPLKLPPIQKRTLSNGLPVWIVEMREVPVVDITLVVKAGAAQDPASAYGVATMTADMLDEGAGSRTALELAEAIDMLGASLGTGSGFDVSTVRLHVPVARLDAALPLMADVALRPTFASPELERLRKLRLTSIQQARDNASAIASMAYSRVLYGPRHRYGTGPSGTETSVTEISVNDLKAFHTAFYQPSHAHLVVVGDVTAAAVLTRLETAFGGWKNTSSTTLTNLPTAPQHASRQVYLVDKPGAAQSQIRLGWIGVPRATSDYFVLDVMNTVLGGSFSSRLNQNLREQHGYAYGAGSAFDMRQSAGPFVASAGVQTDKTVESLREFFKELDGMKQMLPDGELERGRNLQALGFPSAFETTSGMAGNLIDLVVYNLPDTFFNEYVPKIQAVTGAGVQQAANKYLQTDKFAIVVVGDLSKIEAPIRAANLAPVTVLNIADIMK